MSRQDSIVSHLQALIQKADDVLATHTPNPPNVIGFPTLKFEPFSEWQSQSLAYLSNLLGPNHVYLQKFEEQVKQAYTSHVSIGKGILKAVKEDIQGGYLKKIESLVSADIFSDFLEMAEYLLSQGYKDSAASLAGAVLEDGLRRISSNRGVKLKSQEDISSLNQKLADAVVYNRLTQKKIQVWGHIRNNADHGKFSEYSEKDIEDMLKGIRDFLYQYL